MNTPQRNSLLTIVDNFAEKSKCFGSFSSKNRSAGS